MSLQKRFRPWHAVMLIIFVIGSGMSLFRAGDYAFADLFSALFSGLFAVVIFQFTVGNLWAYIVEYRNAGGQWSDAPFLAPFGIAILVGGSVGFWAESLSTGLWVGFWTFVIAAAGIAAGIWFVVGYRQSST